MQKQGFILWRKFHSLLDDPRISYYCRANQEWQWRKILFTLVKFNIDVYTPFEPMQIDRSLVY